MIDLIELSPVIFAFSPHDPPTPLYLNNKGCHQLIPPGYKFESYLYMINKKILHCQLLILLSHSRVSEPLSSTNATGIQI